MRRREFLGAAAASIFAPVFGSWYRQGSGLLVREEGVWTTDLIPAPSGWEWDTITGSIVDAEAKTIGFIPDGTMMFFRGRLFRL